MNMLEHIIFEPRGGMYREFEGLTTHFEPKNLSLYRKLLPEQFSIPSHPVVTVFIADYLRVVTWPTTRYQEWSVMIKSEWKGEEGWYPVTMAVTKWMAMVGGRYLGFPKYVTDEIFITKDKEILTATVKYKSSVHLVLEFKPGTTRQLVPWEKQLDENVSFFKGDVHLLVPPGRGPRAQKIVTHDVTEARWLPQHGMIKIQVDQNELWASLIPDEGPFPGTYNHFIGGANIVAMRLI